jgi:prephenate dehydrogenase
VSQPGHVHIVGAGLLGTSLGLALRALPEPPEVSLADPDERRLALAVDLGAGHAGRPQTDPDVVMVAVPPQTTPSVVLASLRLYPHSIVSDMASVKSQVLVKVQEGLDKLALSDYGDPTAEPEALPRFIGGHPMAGRERSGPEAARADLFAGQPWLLTPSASTAARSVTVVRSLVQSVGAEPVELSASAHDAAVAVVSHTPQVVASAMAAALEAAPGDALALAGPGVRDVTRIAASDPDLWVDILLANAGPVAQWLDAVIADLASTRDALRGVVGAAGIDRLLASSAGRQVEPSLGLQTETTIDRDVDESARIVRELLVHGNRGRARLPGKHGRAPVSYAVVPVVIPDEPGALARLFAAAGEAGVNIEDVSIEHAPGQAVGLVELAVQPQQAAALTARLHDRGWRVH